MEKSGIERIKESYRALITECQLHIPEKDFPLVHHAMDHAILILGESKWENGEFILHHSISVARIAVLELGLSTDSLIACLLHNTFDQKSNYFFPVEVAKEYRPGVAEILEGIIKINSLNTENIAVQSENFRRLMLALSGDVRVILIKIADQLQDMRSLGNLPEAMQQHISIDSWHLYAPLAHRLGLYKINSELLDLSLKYLHPQEYNHILNKLQETRTERANFVSAFVKPIEKKLKSRGYDFEMKARTKSIFSIWNKMKKQEVDFHEVYDLFAIRARAGAELENIRVHVVDEHGAFAGRGGAGGVFVQPQMVGEDDVVGEFGGRALHCFERAHGEGIAGDVKLAAVKFRHDVVDVEENPGAF